MTQAKPISPACVQRPDETAAIEQLLLLAKEYGDTSKFLLDHRRSDGPLSLAPICFAALQAIELYLNTLLLHAGSKQSDLHKMHHSFSERIDAAKAHGLVLRQRTIDHLKALTDDRQFLTLRYDPDKMPKSMHTNRLTATLDEVAKKVVKLVEDKR